MKKLNFKEVFIPTFALFLICAIVTALLGVTNQVTTPLIDEINRKNRDESCLVVLPSADSFRETAVDYNGRKYICFAGFDKDQKPVGMVVITTAKGYGGDVEVMTGISIDGKVTGVQILSMSETPGLGANAQKEEFRSQFIGKNGELKVRKDGGDIEALTGATITSRAVSKAVSEALAVHESI